MESKNHKIVTVYAGKRHPYKNQSATTIVTMRYYRNEYRKYFHGTCNVLLSNESKNNRSVFVYDPDRFGSLELFNYCVHRVDSVPGKTHFSIITNIAVQKVDFEKKNTV